MDDSILEEGEKQILKRQTWNCGEYCGNREEENGIQEKDTNIKEKQSLIRIRIGTSLVVQWLRFCASSGGGPGLIPG